MWKHTQAFENPNHLNLNVKHLALERKWVRGETGEEGERRDARDGMYRSASENKKEHRRRIIFARVESEGEQRER